MAKPQSQNGNSSVDNARGVHVANSDNLQAESQSSYNSEPLASETEVWPSNEPDMKMVKLKKNRNKCQRFQLTNSKGYLVLQVLFQMSYCLITGVAISIHVQNYHALNSHNMEASSTSQFLEVSPSSAYESSFLDENRDTLTFLTRLEAILIGILIIDMGIKLTNHY
jgi:hypothetical protein